MNVALPTYVLLFAFVYDAAAIPEFDHECMKPFVDELVELKVFNPNKEMSDKLILCEEYEISKCYDDFTTKYSDHYETEIVKMFLEDLTQMTDIYNRIVLSYMHEVVFNLEDNVSVDWSSNP